MNENGTGVWQRIMMWLRGAKPAQDEVFNPTGDEAQGDRLAVLDRVNAALPDDMSGRGAVLSQRDRLRKIDEMMGQ